MGSNVFVCMGVSARISNQHRCVCICLYQPGYIISTCWEMETGLDGSELAPLHKIKWGAQNLCQLDCTVRLLFSGPTFRWSEHILSRTTPLLFFMYRGTDSWGFKSSAVCGPVTALTLWSLGTAAWIKNLHVMTQIHHIIILMVANLSCLFFKCIIFMLSSSLS